MGNFSRDTFDKLKHYVGVRLQQGVPIVDADWNEQEDIRKYELQAFIKWFVGNGVPSEQKDSFQILAIKDAGKNFKIKGGNGTTDGAGRCLVEGWDVLIETNLKYTEQPLYNNADLADQWGVKTLNPLTLAADTERTDTVYLDVWEREVTSEEDTKLVNDKIGIETCVRLKREWVVRVREDATEPPSPPAGHVFYALAFFKRSSGQVPITLDNIIDLRTTCPLLSQQDWQTGFNLEPRLTASANNQSLTALRINPIFQKKKFSGDGNFSGIQYQGLIVEEGNVGIGTSTPAYELDVAGTIRTTDNLIKDSKTSAPLSDEGWYRIVQSLPSKQEQTNAGIFELRWSQASRHGQVRFLVSAHYSNSNNAQLMILSNSNNAIKLVDKIRLLMKSFHDQHYVEFHFNGSIQDSNAITFKVYQYAGYGWSLVDPEPTDQIPTDGYKAHELRTDVLFATCSGQNSSTFVIEQAGKVGIGIETPAAKLHVQGNLKLNAGVAVNEFSSDTNLSDDSNSAVPTENAVKTYIDTKAQGSDTQDFDTKDLHVHGKFTVDGEVFAKDIEHVTGNVILGDDDNDQVTIKGVLKNRHSSGALQIQEALQVSDNVGIGRAPDPTYKLDVAGTIRTTDNLIKDSKKILNVSEAKWYKIVKNAGSNVGIFEIRWSGSGRHGQIRFSVGVHYGWNNGAHMMILSHSNYSSPVIDKIRLLMKDTKAPHHIYFHFNGSIQDSNAITFKVYQYAGYGWSLVDPEPTDQIPTDGYKAHELRTDVLFATCSGQNSSAFVIEQAGKVGIGIETPAAKLHVQGNLKLNAGVAVNEFSSDTNLSGNSDSAVPTEKAVKAYADKKALLGGSFTEDFDAKALHVHGNLTVNGNVLSDLKLQSNKLIFTDNNNALIELRSQASTEPNSMTGVILQTKTNPSDEGPIFRVLSSGGAERLRVEHLGALKTDNVIKVDGTGNSYIKGNVSIGTDISETNAKLYVQGNLKLNTGEAVNEFSSDTNLSGDSNSAVPTEKAVKAYADTKALLAGSPTQDFTTRELHVHRNLGIGRAPHSTYKLDVAGQIRSTTGELIKDYKTMTQSQGGWYRIVQSPKRGGENAGIFEICWSAGGRHGHVRFSVGAFSGDDVHAQMIILSRSHYEGGPYHGNIVDKIRLLMKTKEDLHYVDFHFEGYTSNITFKIYQYAGYIWSLVEPTKSDKPTDYTAHELRADVLFATCSGQNSSSFIIEQGGKVGIGIPNPLKKLHVNGDIQCNTLHQSCSLEIKENIETMSSREAIEAISQLRPVKYHYRDSKQFRPYLGFIAEEMPDILAAADRKTITPTEIIPILTTVVQEQQKTISVLQSEIQTLKTQQV